MKVTQRAIDFVQRKSGASQKDIAKYCGVSASTISRIMHGHVVSVSTAEKLTTRLNRLIRLACAENGIII